MSTRKPILAQVLERDRALFNARFAQARQTSSALDGQEFAAHLRETVAPIVEACDATSPERTHEIVEILYEFSLQLVARGSLGAKSRTPFLNQTWRELLPFIANIIVLAPRLVVGSVCNAAFQMSQTPNARAEKWLQTMREIAPISRDADIFLRAGRLAAWRCGLAQTRENALQSSRDLPAEIVFRVLDLPREIPHDKSLTSSTNAPNESQNASQNNALLKTDLSKKSFAENAFAENDLSKMWAQLENDLWISPAEVLQNRKSSTRNVLQLRAQVGDFRGFGGEFLAPPRVNFFDGALHVSDGESANSWRIFADIYGATLLRATPENSIFNATFGAIANWNRVLEIFPEAQNALSAATDGRTIAVTIPTSHRVFLFA